VPSIAFDSRGIGERLDPISRRRVRCSACSGMAARNPGPPVFVSALEDGLAGVAFVIANDKAPIAVVKATGSHRPLEIRSLFSAELQALKFVSLVRNEQGAEAMIPVPPGFGSKLPPATPTFGSVSGRQHNAARTYTQGRQRASPAHPSAG
jgi:hypothetical protein